MESSNRHLVRILRSGFGLILVLNLILGVVGLSQLHRVRVSMAAIVEVNNAKMEYAYAMRDAIRLRALSTTKMLATDDYFERDEELIKFYGYAAVYREAREKLVKLGLNSQEAAIHERLNERTKVAQPLNRAAAELLFEDAPEAEFRKAVKAAALEQEKVLQLLDKSIDLEKRFSQQTLAVARKESNLTIIILLLAGVFIIVLEAFIAKLVIRFVSEKNRDLARKNTELAYASHRADEATRAKTEFLANMSHEIRTPLTTIIGFSDSLVNLKLTESEHQLAVNSIHHSSMHLFDIINDILDISKIETGKIDYEIIDVNPVKLVSEVLAIIGEKARSNGLVLETLYEFPIPRLIKSDPTRLKQILLNLCSNALKFTPVGKITINIRYDQNAAKLLFLVEDTGIGMDPNQIKKIFQVFQQADSSTTRRYGGTGLGLSISRQIARDLGGDIVCQSAENKGSTFSVSIAAGIEAADLIFELESELQSPGKTQETLEFKARVLLAEDSLDIQALLCMYLCRVGIEPVVAHNGIQAYELALQQEFDLVLMDMQMPRMDGLQAITELRRKGYDKPIIMLSANAIKHNRVASIQAGAQDYLAKPVDFNKLCQVLSSYLSPAQQRFIGEQALPAIALDPEFEALVGEFLANLPVTISQLARCVEAGDLAQLSVKAHKLKGAGGSFGFPELSNRAKRLMTCATSGDFSQTAKLVAELKQYSRDIVKKAG